MRRSYALTAVVAAAFVWIIPFAHDPWLKYLLFVVSPLVIGITIRRLLLRRESREDQQDEASGVSG